MRYELELTTENGLPVLASPKFICERSILICFTTRLGGVSPAPYDALNLGQHVGDDPANVMENRRRVLSALGLDETRLKTVRQVHGNGILRVDEKKCAIGATETGDIEADALMTGLNKTPIAVFTADCVPVVLADAARRKITVVHAGWKGIYSLIVPRALAAMKEAVHSETGDVYAFIGPAVGPCCYEVDEARAGLFGEKYIDRQPGKIRLDLPAIVRDQLREAGLEPDRISGSGLCTCCRKDLFFSFRRDGICGRQMAAAALLEA
ncbi:MAG: peptidoglycan editing factor PgeF [Actinomycetota bacterium]